MHKNICHHVTVLARRLANELTIVLRVGTGFQFKLLACLIIVANLGLVGCYEEPSSVATKMPQKNGARPNIGGISASIGQSPALAKTPLARMQRSGIRSNRSAWTQYRGRLGMSMARRSEIPTTWSSKENIWWRSELPGRGASSPVVIDDKIFVTAYSGYGISAEEPGDIKDLMLHVICIHRDTGEYLWKKDIQGSPLTQRLNAELFRHGFASSTPVVDEDNVYVFFGASGVYAFSHDGEYKWRADVGFGFNYFGSSASLITFDNLLIVNASIESNSIFGIEKETGKGVWKIDGIDRSFSMPVLGEPFDKRTIEMVVMEEDFVRGYDPKTGEELWHCAGVNNYVVSTPFISEGVCYCNGGIQKQMMAIKLGGKGDVSETHKLWEVPQGANVTSPIYISGQLFVLADNSILHCFDALTGELISRKRTPSKARAYSSPLYSDNLLYVPLEDQGVFVCKATSEFEEVSHNTFEADPNSLKASLAATRMRIFLRNDKYLYCIGSDAPETIDVALSDFSPPNEESLTFEPRYDYAAGSWRRPYNYYLDPFRPSVDKIIIKPYETLLNEEQVEEAKKLIDAKIIRFDDLRAQQKEAYWKLLQSGSKAKEELKAALVKIEDETMQLANAIRMKIKTEVMSKEQLEQHQKEVAQLRAKREKTAEANAANPKTADSKSKEPKKDEEQKNDDEQE